MSKLSKLKRAKARKQAHIKFSQEFNAWGPRLVEELTRAGVPADEINKRMRSAMLWGAEARSRGEPARFIAFNMGRIMHGHEPLQRRQAVRPSPTWSRRLVASRRSDS